MMGKRHTSNALTATMFTAMAFTIVVLAVDKWNRSAPEPGQANAAPLQPAPVVPKLPPAVDHDHILFRRYLAENSDTGEWEEVRYYGRQPLAEADWNRIYNRGVNSISGTFYWTFVNAHDSVCDCTAAVRMKYRETSSGSKRLHDTILLLDKDGHMKPMPDFLDSYITRYLEDLWPK